MQHNAPKELALVGNAGAQAFLDALFRTDDQGLCILDADGHVLRASGPFLELAGRTEDELLGQHFSILAPPRERALAKREFADFIAGLRDSHAGEWLLFAKAGELSTIRVRTIRVDVPGLGRHALLRVRETAGTRDDARMRLISDAVDASNSAVAIASPDLDPPGPRFLYVNRAYCELVGYAREELIGRPARDVGGPETSPEALARLKAALEGGTAHRERLKIHRCDGRSVLVEMLVSPVRGEDGCISHWTAVHQDMSREADRERRLKESEERLQLTVSASGDGIWDWNLESGALYWSDRLLEMLGLTADRFVPLAETFFERLHPEDRERVDTAIRAHLDEQAPFDMQYRLRHEDGRYIQVSAQGQASWNAQRRATRMVGTVSDITRLVRLRDNLLRAERIAHIGHWRVNAGSSAVEWSPETFRIHGRTPEEFAPDVDSAIDAYHPDDRALVRAAVEAALQQGRPCSYDARIVRPDGELRYVRVGGEVEMDQGRVQAMFGTIQDITQRVNREQQLHQAQKMEVVGQLAGGVAHDFNNLLSVVLGNLELLADAGDESLRREFVQDALHATLRGKELTQNLLSFARRATLAPETLDLNHVIKNMFSFIRRTLPEHILIETDLADRLWPVHADRTATESSLLNLVINSRDAMENGGLLEISTRNHEVRPGESGQPVQGLAPGRYVCVSVRDTGRGIAPELLPEVFEPFFSTKQPGKGSGLGLSMVQGFAIQSGGTVRIASEPGEGTTVTIWFRARPSVEGEGREAGSAAASALTSPAP